MISHNTIDPVVIEKLNKKLDELIAEFDGKVSHRNAQSFKAKLKEYLKQEGIHGDWWLHDLLKKRGL